MKNKYESPAVELIAAEALSATNVSTGDIDVEVGEDFF